MQQLELLITFHFETYYIGGVLSFNRIGMQLNRIINLDLLAPRTDKHSGIFIFQTLQFVSLSVTPQVTSFPQSHTAVLPAVFSTTLFVELILVTLEV